jgi:hypothetical protein
MNNSKRSKHVLPIFHHAKLLVEENATITNTLAYISRSYLLRNQYYEQYKTDENKHVPDEIIKDGLIQWISDFSIFVCTSMDTRSGVLLTIDEHGNIVWIDSLTGPNIPSELQPILPEEEKCFMNYKKELSVFYPVGSIITIYPKQITWCEMKRRFWITAFNAKYNCSWNSSFGPFYWLL